MQQMMWLKNKIIKDDMLQEDWASTSGALPFGKCTAIHE